MVYASHANGNAPWRRPPPPLPRQPSPDARLVSACDQRTSSSRVVCHAPPILNRRSRTPRRPARVHRYAASIDTRLPLRVGGMNRGMSEMRIASSFAHQGSGGPLCMRAMGDAR